MRGHDDRLVLEPVLYDVVKDFLPDVGVKGTHAVINNVDVSFFVYCSLRL